MQFLITLAALASLVAAAPAADPDFSLTAVPVEIEAPISARQTYGICNPGYKAGDYGCFANIANPNDKFSYLGQCGTDNHIHVSLLGGLVGV